MNLILLIHMFLFTFFMATGKFESTFVVHILFPLDNDGS